jgi:ATP-dependent Clp protease protease subunit
MTPYIFEKTKDGEVLYDVYSRLVKDRILFLAGDDGIDNESATALSASLLLLDSQSHTKPINLYINTPGGAIHSGLYTIFDTMNFIEAPVHTVCIGTAYSAGSFLLAAGAKGNRLAFPNAHIMMHEPSNYSGSGSIKSTSDLVKEAELISKINQDLINLMAKLTGQSEAKVKTIVKEETYFTAQEALKFGIIDRIVGDKTNVPKQKKS